MSEAKDELVRQKELIITKMKEWENQASWCRGQISEIRRAKKSAPVSDVDDVLKEIEDRLFNASISIHRSSDDLDHLENFFKFQRSNLEVRKFAFDSWPESRYVQQMLWVATVLVSLGGGAFGAGIAWTKGELLASIVAPAFFWTAGLVLLAKSLSGLREIDRQKMEFYKKEFDIGGDLNQIARKG